MARRVITKQDVDAARDGTLAIGPDDVVTAAALEAAARARVAIVRGEPEASAPAATPQLQAPNSEPRTPSWDPFAPGAAAPTSSDGAPSAIVTAIGRNRPFVLSEITTRIGELNGDILDISQRIVSGYFSTILVVDVGRVTGDFATFKRALEALSREGDYRIVVQHERIFRAMHRI